MSADNGIYILRTPNFTTGHTEFRVALCSAIENIEFPGERDKWLSIYFGSCEVLHSELRAISKAQNILKEIEGYVEYGMQTITLDKEFPRTS